MLEILKWSIMKSCASVHEKPISKEQGKFSKFSERVFTL